MFQCFEHRMEFFFGLHAGGDVVEHQHQALGMVILDLGPRNQEATGFPRLGQQRCLKILNGVVFAKGLNKGIAITARRPHAQFHRRLANHFIMAKAKRFQPRLVNGIMATVLNGRNGNQVGA